MEITSHDVRRMRVCYLCKKLGIYKPKNADVKMALVIQVSNRLRLYAHPRCFEKLGRPKLLALPLKELAHIRLCDVSMRTMQAILDVEHP